MAFSLLHSLKCRPARKRLSALAAGLMLCVGLSAQNPYLPLWEHIPDGEPYVFEDPDRPGRYRVYVYGSHDNLVTAYCGLEQVVWSAPVEALDQWRFDGRCFESRLDAFGQWLNPGGKGDLLYAPDIAERVEEGRKVYYFYPNNKADGRKSMVAKGYRPDGPFKVCNWDESGRRTSGCLGFDPAVLIDDDGRVYGYWGFNTSYMAELDPLTMAHPKPGTEILCDRVTSRRQEGEFRFFEASSIRKILGKYVFVYSRYTAEGEFGLPSANYTLAYAYGDSPLGPWTYGGTLIDGRGRDTDEQGWPIATGYCGGNTHGGLVYLNGRWWVFYHRHSGTDEYSRQAMVAPVEVKLDKQGRLLISEGEVTSEGFHTEGLDPFCRTAAGWACYFTGPRPMGKQYPRFMPSGSYPQATRPAVDSLESVSGLASMSLNHPQTPMVNNTAGSVVGYKYFRMDALSKAKEVRLVLNLQPLKVPGVVTVMIDSPYESRGGRVIGRLHLSGEEASKPQELAVTLNGLRGVKGKHSLYFRFDSEVPDASLCTLYDFVFQASR